MKTAEKVLTVMAIICAVMALICAVTSFAAGSYLVAVSWMVLFSIDALDAYRYIGMWIDFHKTIKETQNKIDTLSD